MLETTGVCFVLWSAYIGYAHCLSLMPPYGAVSEFPNWNCTGFKRYHGQYVSGVLSKSFFFLRNLTLEGCEAACVGEPRCGTYAFFLPEGSWRRFDFDGLGYYTRCRGYQFTFQLLLDAGIPDYSLSLGSSSSVSANGTTGMRDCEANVIEKAISTLEEPPMCLDKQSIDNYWGLRDIFYMFTPESNVPVSLQDAYRKLCGRFSACKSMRIYGSRYGGNDTESVVTYRLTMFNSSIAEMVEVGAKISDCRNLHDLCLVQDENADTTSCTSKLTSSPQTGKGSKAKGFL